MMTMTVMIDIYTRTKVGCSQLYFCFLSFFSWFLFCCVSIGSVI